MRKCTQEKEKRLSFESQISDLKIQISSLTCERNELTRKHDDLRSLTSQLEAEILKLQLNYNRATDAEVRVYCGILNIGSSNDNNLNLCSIYKLLFVAF